MCRYRRGLCVVLLILAGCGGRVPARTDEGSSLLEVAPSDRPAPPAQSRRYQLKAGDRLAIQVLTDPDLSSAAEIQMDGRVTVPWAGTIQASGRTLPEVKAEIEDSLSVLLRYPMIALSIQAFGPSRVYVTGEVSVAGAYVIEAGQTVLGAIAAAGGLLPTANTQEVLLLRRTGETEAAVHRVNIQRVLKGADKFADPLVQHQDIIHVPRTLIADINLFVSQFFTQMRPTLDFYLEGWEAFNVSEVSVTRFVR